MKSLLVISCLVTAVYCHILANGDHLDVHTVLGGAVTVKLEYPTVGLPIPNCCSNTKILQQPVLAGAVVTEVAHLRDLGYLLHLDFMENIVTCRLIPDVEDTNDLSSTLCPHLTCPAGWNLLQGSCFLVSQVSGSWGEGQTFCQQRGGELATISSHFQQMALSDILTTDTWIGLRQRHEDPTFGWTDGSSITYTSWAQDEHNISDPAREVCVEMRQRYDFLWNTAQCSESKRYVCSIPGTAITPARPSTTTTPTTSPTTTTTPTTSPTTTIMTTTHTPECESGWSEYQSSCYKVFKEVVNQADATANCRALGAYLASIGSEGENSFVGGLVTSFAYIGLSDKEREGVFTWQDGSPFNYSKWWDGQPNNAGGNQDCVRMSAGYGFKWYDEPCSNRLQYICEKSVQ